MTGKGQGKIDKLHPDDSKDAIGYGQTFEEAATSALQKHLGES
jgi:ATP-dependent protease HslVU (ClpYQ) peptidase subunit